MENKHTAGKWKTTEVHNGYYSIGTGAVEYIDTKGQLKQGYRPIAFVGGNYCPVDEAEANAKLIAAAPELLEALIETQKLIENVRQYLPKSIKNSDKFHFENIVANVINKAINQATNQ